MVVARNWRVTSTSSPWRELFLLPPPLPPRLPAGAGEEFLLERRRWPCRDWYFSRMCDVWSLIEWLREAALPPCRSVTAGLEGQRVDMVGFLAGLPRLPGPEPPLLPWRLPAVLGGPEGGTHRVTTCRCRSPRSFVSAENRESKFCSIVSIGRLQWSLSANQEILLFARSHPETTRNSLRAFPSNLFSRLRTRKLDCCRL